MTRPTLIALLVVVLVVASGRPPIGPYPTPYLEEIAWAAATAWPLELELQSAPGEPARGRIAISNVAPEPRLVTFHLTDWITDIEGHRQFLPAGEQSRSLAPYLRYEPEGPLRLEPGESRTIDVTATLPPGKTGSHWTALTVLTEPAGAAQRISGAPRLQQRQRVRIYHTVSPTADGAPNDPVVLSGPESPTVDAGTVRVVHIAPLTPSADTFSVSVTHGGDDVLPITGEWRLVNGSGQIAVRREWTRFRMYPGQTRRLTVGPLPTLPPGPYLLLVVLHPDRGRPVAGQLAFSVSGKDS